MDKREKKKRNLKLYELWKKGLSYRQLGKIFEINESAVFYIVKRYKSEEKK